jgi:hypothetical protein
MRNILLHFGFEGGCLLKEGEGTTEERNKYKKKEVLRIKLLQKGRGERLSGRCYDTQPSQAVQMFDLI